MADSAVRLCGFRVSSLFGEFNHSIPFCQTERMTALIGPNGMGKTVCLRLINALFQRQWSVFDTTEFEEITYEFSDGSTVEVRRSDESDQSTAVSEALGITFKTTRPGLSEPERWSPRPADEQIARAAKLEAYLPFLTRVGSRNWRLDGTRQLFSLQEVIELYGQRLPEAMRRSLSNQPSAQLASIIDQIDCHLIETQRLLVLEQDDFRRQQANPISNLTISMKAKTLKTIIANELAQYASISQSLDRSFPRRVLQQAQSEPSSNFSSNLADLDELRRGLTEAGILDLEEDDAFPIVQDPNPAIASVLNVYMKDTKQKLGVLEKLRAKIILFVELLDSRFKPKTIFVDKEIGFRVKRSDTIDVPLEKLSSGEQHQLVLFFELLFELRQNALILIDEPELSLHVAWQRQFIPDLRRIIELNEFDVLIATHSPQLVGAWDEIVVELGDVHVS